MRTYKLLSLALLVCMTYIHAQAQPTYTSTTVYTPANTPVNAWRLVSGDLTQAQKNSSKNYWLNYYNNRITYKGEATYSYNCHAYAWHVSEGGSNVWIGLDISEINEEDKYWSDLSYVEVPNQAAATKVSFGGPCWQYWTIDGNTEYTNPCNHSAITTTTTNYFISKWGKAPLFLHSKNDCPYSIQDLHYYAPLSISGPSIVCSSGGSFTINNLPTGATITWSQGPYLTRTSAQGANPCIFSSTGSGSSWIRATLVKGSNTITLTDKVVWSGVPQVTVTGPSVGYIGGSYTYYANTAPGAQITSYQWTLTPPYDGNNIYGYGYWANTSFNNPNGGYFQIGCTVSNNCGSGIMGTTYISISETKNDYIVSPNPASTIITISVVPAVSGAKGLTDFNAVYDVSIHDMNGVLQSRKEYSGDCFTIPVDNLKDGNYLIRIDNGKFVSVKQVIIKR